MKNSKAIHLLLAILAVVLVPKICAAETMVIPVSGSGQIADNKSENSLVVVGSGFSFSGVNAGSNGAYCGFNMPCSPFLEGDVIGQWSDQSYSGFADASMKVVTTFPIGGNPCAPANTCDNVTAGPFPASFMASITAVSGDSIAGTIVGTGTVDLTGGNAEYPDFVYFNTVAFGFDGNTSLSISPEPGSIVLAGSGMLALLGVIRRKNRAKHCR
jgi:hypothetical protein